MEGKPTEWVLLYSRLTKARASAEAERDRAAREADGFEQMIEGLLKIHPEVLGQEVLGQQTESAADLTIRQTDGTTIVIQAKTRHPRGNPAIDNVVSAVNSLSGWVMARDVVAALSQRGLLPDADDPMAAVRVSLRRAWRAGRLERSTFDGRTNMYRAIRAENAETPALTEVSGGATSRVGGESDAPPEANRYHGDSYRGQNRDHDHGAPVGAST